MNSFNEFKMYAGMFAAFWLLISLRSVWKKRESYDERAAKFKKRTDKLIATIDMLPFPQIFPLLFIGVYLFYIAIDLTGVALLHLFISKADLFVKMISIILLLESVDTFRDFIGDLRVMRDEQRFRERLYCYPNPRRSWALYICSWIRFIASLILFTGIFM